MKSAKFQFTDSLVHLLKMKLSAASIDLTIILNADDDDDDDFGTDDGIEFARPDGTKLDLYISSGPYGIGLNTAIYDNTGAFEGVKHGRAFEVTMLDALTDHTIEQLRQLPESDATGLHPR